MEIKPLYGALPPKYDVRDYRYISGAKEASEYPETFELDIPKVKNQGNVSSCVAHALSYIIEYYNEKQEGTYCEFSTGFIYGYRTPYSYKDAGMYLRDALATAKNVGDVDYSTFCYNEEVPDVIELINDVFDIIKDEAWPNRISTYVSLNTIGDMKDWLMNYGPIMINIPCYTNGLNVVQGNIDMPNGQVEGYHCISVWGWNKTGWIILNSWGNNWGENGMAILPYEYPMIEQWGVTDTILNKKVEKLPLQSIFNPFYKLWNYLMNFFGG